MEIIICSEIFHLIIIFFLLLRSSSVSLPSYSFFSMQKEVMENGEWYQGVLEDQNESDIRIKRSIKLEKEWIDCKLL